MNLFCIINLPTHTHLNSSVLIPEQFRADDPLWNQFFAGFNQITQLNLEGQKLCYSLWNLNKRPLVITENLWEKIFSGLIFKSHRTIQDIEHSAMPDNICCKCVHFVSSRNVDNKIWSSHCLDATKDMINILQTKHFLLHSMKKQQFLRESLW